VLYFSPFRFDERDLTLWEGPVRVRLTHKASALLHCLLDHAGEWVGNAQILERVWPETHVQPDNIKVLIRELRRTLHDDARHPAYICNQAGRGYKFVASVSDSFDGSGPEPGESIPAFVDRGPELAALADELDAAAAGESRVVLVTGARGIGKSSLCQVFLRTAQALCDARHAIGCCAERYTHAEPYAPFLEALQRLVRQYPDRVHELLIEHAPAWRAFFPEWSPRRAGGPTACSDTAPVSDADMLDQLVRFLAHLGREKPVVLLIEDLQWADPSTLVAFSTLAERRDAGRFLIVGTATGGPLPGRYGRLSAARRRGARAIVVPRLSEVHVARYLNVRFGLDAVSALAPALHRLTAGNPQLLCTSLSRIIDLGYLARPEHRWQLVAPIEVVEAALAHSVADALEGCLALIPDDDCRILEHAALVGEEFTAESIAAAAECESRLAERRLARLASEGYLEPVPSGGHWRVSDRRFRFTYPLQAELLRRRASILLRMRVAERLALRGADAHRQPA
jgi:DNA-binding winged helix-turn-helix (wHTH) protein